MYILSFVNKMLIALCRIKHDIFLLIASKFVMFFIWCFKPQESNSPTLGGCRKTLHQVPAHPISAMIRRQGTDAEHAVASPD